MNVGSGALRAKMLKQHESDPVPRKKLVAISDRKGGGDEEVGMSGLLVAGGGTIM